jgi:hypothetical protein
MAEGQLDHLQNFKNFIITIKKIGSLIFRS